MKQFKEYEHVGVPFKHENGRNVECADQGRLEEGGKAWSHFFTTSHWNNLGGATPWTAMAIQDLTGGS